MSNGEVRISDTERDALAYVRRHEGRKWKANLRAAWTNGTVNRLAEDEQMASVLQRLRNRIGPSGLDDYKP